MAYTLDRAGSPSGPAIATLTAIQDLGVALGPVLMGIVIRLTKLSDNVPLFSCNCLINVNYFYFLVRK